MLPLAILAGGFGTRLGLRTKEHPKSLIKINGRPFVDWQLELLCSHGYSDFVFCVSYKSEMIESYLGDGGRFGVRIRYSIDGDSQLGTGGAIRKAIPLLGDRFGVIYGDSYLPISYPSVEEKFKNASLYALMTVYEDRNELENSNVEYTNGRVVNYDKSVQSANMKHIDFGLSYFSAKSFLFPEFRTDFDLAEVYKKLAKEEQIAGFEVFEKFYEIGSVQGIDQLSNHLRRVSQ
jgi:MurNAc alpha-1-phosphate uridylyltransferase